MSETYIDPSIGGSAKKASLLRVHVCAHGSVDQAAKPESRPVSN